MNSLFRPSTIDDEEQLIEFLARVFSVDNDAPFVNPALLRWKYWEPRADCGDPRSFVIERAGRIVAHVGLWPVTVRNGATSEEGAHMIDWAADPQAPGTGVLLLQRLARKYDFIYTIGGSEITQAILPRFGFQTVAQALTFARPIRPWRQILQHQHKDIRLPLRLARNIWWSLTPGRGPMSGWTTTEAAPTEVAGYAALSRERDERFFRYLQQCPSARFMNFHILNEGKRAGLFMLSIIGKQARLAGAWLENPSPEFWRIAFHLAQDAALRHTTAAELVARATAEDCAVAAAQAGMRVRGQAPVFVYRKDGGDLLPLPFQIVDNDSLFLGSRRTSFLT